MPTSTQTSGKQHDSYEEIGEKSQSIAWNVTHFWEILRSETRSIDKQKPLEKVPFELKKIIKTLKKDSKTQKIESKMDEIGSKTIKIQKTLKSKIKRKLLRIAKKPKKGAWHQWPFQAQ